MNIPLTDRFSKSIVAPILGALLMLGIGAGAGFLLRGKCESAPTGKSASCGEGAGAGEGIRLPPKAGTHNRIETLVATRTKLARDVEVVGSVSYDADHFAEVGPLIAGRIVGLHAGVGDKVQIGQVLGELESAEVGQAEAAYVTAKATSLFAQANLRRERELAEHRIASVRDRELAESKAAIEAAALTAAIQRLRTLGLRPEDIRELDHGGSRLGLGPGRVPLLSPISGTIVTREVSLGQAVQPAADAFKVAHLSHLWVLLDLFEKDLLSVYVGQRAELRTDVSPGKTFPARVAYVGQVIDEKTRTAPVRIEFDNADELFRPGQFVTAMLRGDPARAQSEVLAVPRTAVMTSEGKSLVFIARDDGSFIRRTVELGASGGGLVEIRHGLTPGERVAVDGAFLLKSELQR